MGAVGRCSFWMLRLRSGEGVEAGRQGGLVGWPTLLPSPRWAFQTPPQGLRDGGGSPALSADPKDQPPPPNVAPPTGPSGQRLFSSSVREPEGVLGAS